MRDDERKLKRDILKSPRDFLRALLCWFKHKKSQFLQHPVFATKPRDRFSVKNLSLSSKLLLLTISFVMIAEILIFLPSVSNFRKNWFMERLETAQIAALAREASPGHKLPEMLKTELLRNAQVYAVALRRDNTRQLVLEPHRPLQIADFYDLRQASAYTLMKDAILLFFYTEPRFVRVVGEPKYGAGEFIDIVVDEAACREAALQFAGKILGLSIVISIITAALVYLALNALLIRPMMRITHNMVRFREDPEDPSRIITPTDRGDEIGTAERQLAEMQTQLAGTLLQKSRLASLGLAVSKINHDLRNMLASAHLISDRLSTIEDPQVERFTPKLINSLDRAVRLCTNTLRYGQAPEPAPEKSLFSLTPLVHEVGESLDLPDHKTIQWNLDMAENLQVYADKDQIYRVLMNLCRNAVQVLEAEIEFAYDADEVYEIGITAWSKDDCVSIEVRDTGPGLPPKAKEYLFDAFKGNVRKGGTGLGLAIAQELVRANRGKLELVETVKGAKFRISLPSKMPD